MAKVKLYAVIGGRNNWRLKTDREAAQHLREFNYQRVKVFLPGYDEFYLDNQMRVYSYYTLTHGLSIIHGIVQRMLLPRLYPSIFP